MQQKISPRATLVIVIVVIAVMGGIFALTSRPDQTKMQETAKRGEDVGQKMMQSLQSGSHRTGP